jgi:hypothetical protein
VIDGAAENLIPFGDLVNNRSYVLLTKAGGYGGNWRDDQRRTPIPDWLSDVETNLYVDADI